MMSQEEIEEFLYKYKSTNMIFVNDKDKMKYNRILLENIDLKNRLDKIKKYIDKYLYEHIIEDLPDEESKFEKEDGTPIPNAKEEIYKILEVNND